MFKFFIVKNDYKVTAKLFSDLEQELLAEGNEWDENNPDYVFVVGGDGTFLKAVHQFQTILSTTAFIPFKSGGIGFYTNRNNIKDLNAIVKALNQGTMQVSAYEVLELKNGANTHYICNELKILNEKSLTYLKIFLNDDYLETFHGTGLVISTASGSTGYMKSTGGAVIFPKNSGIYQLQELVPVSTNKYRTLNSPLILDKNTKVKLVLEGQTDTLICDTQERQINSQELEICMSAQQVKVLCFNPAHAKSEVEVLREIFIKDKEVIE